MEPTGVISLVGAIIAIIASAISSIIAIRKSKPEVEKTKAEVEKAKAEIVEIYADELRQVKEENKSLRVSYNALADEFKMSRNDFDTRLNQQILDRKEEQLRYREFINELLLGIARLTGQIQMTGVPPVWVPPTKTPFDCE